MKADELWQIILGSGRSEWKYEVIHDEHKGVEFGTGAPWSGPGC
jgi:hypothetical protein